MTFGSTQKNRLLLDALRGVKTERAPIWLMRQAGRYLPEYRELRTKAGGFLAMVYDPALASEITLQPIRRFGMDGAILFSDILVIPQALGQSLRFEQGEGPRLDALSSLADIAALRVETIDETLDPVYETVRETRRKLSIEGLDHTALIGFAGGLWTVACYMIEGKGGSDFAGAKAWAGANPDAFAALMDKLSAATLHYLSRQIEAGVQAVQIFESWAGVVEEENFDAWVIAPTRRLVQALKQRYPDIPVIGFPRGASLPLMTRFAAETGVDALGCDYDHAPENLAPLQQSVCVQGNLDPEILLAGGAPMDEAARRILDALSGGPFVFNLGHGVIKETDPAQVDRLVKLVQEYRS